MESTIKVQPNTQAFNLLKYTFGIVPIVAGADKFTNILTQWDQYINPTIAGLLPFSASAFMAIVGVVEIVAGIIVLRNPKSLPKLKSSIGSKVGRNRFTN